MFNVVNIIPTGVGAEIGGFAGDANPFNSLLESICDNVITHPNAVNAASLYPATSKTLYVEGFALDKFLEGTWNLKRKNNKIGIVIDKKAIFQLTHITNAINSCISTFGIDSIGYTITEENIEAKVIKASETLYSGEIGNKETLLKSAKKLIDNGANSIAIFAVLDNPYEEGDQSYLSGNGADPIGRIEAMISHLVVENFKVPSAHAPVLKEYERKVVDPRVSAEEIGYTYIPCVLRGLQFAPQYFDRSSNENNCLKSSDVNAVIAPASCMNGDWVNSVINQNIPLISVKENKTVLDDYPEKFGLENKVIYAENYLEAIGILCSLKAGINYKSVRRPLNGIKEII